MTLTEAQTYLAKLEDALASGVKSVTLNGRLITYQDIDAMRAEADRLRRDIQAQQGRPRVRTFVWEGSK